MDLTVYKYSEYYKVITPNDELNEMLELSISHFNWSNHFIVKLDTKVGEVKFLLLKRCVKIRYSFLEITLEYAVYTNKLLGEYLDAPIHMFNSLIRCVDTQYGIDLMIDHPPVVYSDTNDMVYTHYSKPFIASMNIVDHKHRLIVKLKPHIEIAWAKLKDVQRIVADAYESFSHDITVKSRSYLLHGREGIYVKDNKVVGILEYTYSGDTHHNYESLLIKHFYPMLTARLI